jgi:hypothetical protein
MSAFCLCKSCAFTQVGTLLPTYLFGRVVTVRSFLLLTAVALQATAALPSVFEQYGNIYYRAPDRNIRELTRSGNFGEPTLSPDGHTVAFIHQDSRPRTDGETGLTSLWVGNGLDGKVHKLLAPRPDDKPERNLAFFTHPVFSLDGGYVYVEAEAWATSTAIHQVSLVTGQERFVVGGWIYGILRNGPYRGYLIVGEHRYYPAPGSGSYNPDFIIRPDGKEILRIPGTEIDDGRDRLTPWLKMKGWRL